MSRRFKKIKEEGSADKAKVKEEPEDDEDEGIDV
jgi:hypothetical protein